MLDETLAVDNDLISQALDKVETNTNISRRGIILGLGKCLSEKYCSLSGWCGSRDENTALRLANEDQSINLIRR